MNPVSLIPSMIPSQRTGQSKKPPNGGGGGEWLYALAGIAIAGVILLVGYLW